MIQLVVAILCALLPVFGIGGFMLGARWQDRRSGLSGSFKAMRGVDATKYPPKSKESMEAL